MNAIVFIMLASHLWFPRMHMHFHFFPTPLIQVIPIEEKACAIEEVPKEKEDETLISSPVSFGAYGAFTMKFSQLKGDFAYLMGGRGGLVINHAFVFGGAGYGLSNEIRVDTHIPPGNYAMDFGYGGVFFEYVLASRKMLHLSINALIGGGGVTYHTDGYEIVFDDAFFVTEPGVDLELNFSRHFRIGIGGSYRYVNGVNLFGLTDGDLSGPAAKVNFKFGHF